MYYNVFVRNFWKRNRNRAGGREPSLGKRSYIARHITTEEEARSIARTYNATHEPGFLSRKAEIESRGKQ